MIQPDKDSKNGVQSLEIGMSVARVLVNSQGPMMLKDIALQADMPPAKAHRYLVSLIRAGMVIQDPATSHYDLGPFALNIGLAAVNRIDRIRLGLEAISRLRNQINETTALAVWSANGPVIVRWERPRRPITVNVVTGVSVELLNSASGLVFSAWLPERRTSALIQAELARQPADAPAGDADNPGGPGAGLLTGQGAAPGGRGSGGAARDSRRGALGRRPRGLGE